MQDKIGGTVAICATRRLEATRGVSEGQVFDDMPLGGLCYLIKSAKPFNCCKSRNMFKITTFKSQPCPIVPSIDPKLLHSTTIIHTTICKEKEREGEEMLDV